jgi:hypothetical protein
MVVGPVLRRRWGSGALAVLLLAGFMVVIRLNGRITSDENGLRPASCVLRPASCVLRPASARLSVDSAGSSCRRDLHGVLCSGAPGAAPRRGLELQIMSMVAVTYAGNAISV